MSDTDIGYEPLFARVLLEREKIKTTGIIIPESVEKRNMPEKGIVLKVGPTADDSVKALVGKSVYFAKFAGAWLKVGDRDIYVCQDEDLLLGEAV